MMNHPSRLEILLVVVLSPSFTIDAPAVELEGLGTAKAMF